MLIEFFLQLLNILFKPFGACGLFKLSDGPMLFKLSVKCLYRIATRRLKYKRKHGVHDERGRATRHAQRRPRGALEMLTIGHSLGARVLRKGVMDSLLDGCCKCADSLGGADEGVGGVVL